MSEAHAKPTTGALKPCPFLHEVKRGVFLDIDCEGFGCVRGACSDCGAGGPFVDILDVYDGPTETEKSQAIAAWNTRPSPIAEPQDSDDVNPCNCPNEGKDDHHPLCLRAARLEAPIAEDALVERELLRLTIRNAMAKPGFHRLAFDTKLNRIMDAIDERAALQAIHEKKG